MRDFWERVNFSIGPKACCGKGAHLDPPLALVSVHRGVAGCVVTHNPGSALWIAVVILGVIE